MARSYLSRAGDGDPPWTVAALPAVLSSRPVNDLFLRACRGETVERPPVWMMRQAGRFLPEYRAILERTDFLTVCHTPELATEVTLQPVRRLGVDAAILFADILLPLETLGVGLDFGKGVGPRIERPVRRREDLSGLSAPAVDRDLGYVFDAVRSIRRELDGQVPLIGFAGTPWTVAAYLVEGGTSKYHDHLLGWSYRDPQGLARLLEHLADLTVDYLLGQVEAGAQAIQLFDSWGGLLDLERWRALALPPVVRILEGLGNRVPTIFYVRGGAHLLTGLAELPVDVLSVDWRQPLSQVREVVGTGKVLQGNLDPGALLGTPDEVRARTRALLEDGRGGGHIANLGHGILPMTPVANAQAFVDTVQGSGGRR
ncbi:MAG: uroporphyrinogen decarboxylase [Acidobacteria bacterium]|nr:uroporphyrinogen decarboxylase [Acidobacteriota bacterium]